jgi:hypothetical protein
MPKPIKTALEKTKEWSGIVLSWCALLLFLFWEKIFRWK